MKRVLIGALFVLFGATATLAQAQGGYVDLLVGGQSGGGNYQSMSIPRSWSHVSWTDTIDGSARAGGMGSFDFGYFFKKNMGLHVGYLYNAGRYTAHIYVDTSNVGSYSFNQGLSIIEAGPEIVFGDRENQEFLQFNLGYAFGGGSPQLTTYGGSFPLGKFSDQSLVFGATFGYRHFFSHGVGVTVQGSLHHLQNYAVTDLFDARIGIVWRFN